MKNTIKVFWNIAIIAIFTLSMTNCFNQSLNSPVALKEYLDKQPANSQDKPIKITMTINNPMFMNVAEVIKSTGKYVSLNISSNILTAIPNEAFYDKHGCETLVSINIPNSVTSIGNKAFCFCTSLTSISIPNGITEIKEETFESCTNLTSVTIPDSVTSIEYGAFKGCKSLTNITIPNSITEIDREAFTGCYNLSSIIIPDSVTKIDMYAFLWSGLISVTFQGNITSNNLEGYSAYKQGDAFPGDLRKKYLASGIGTYTRPSKDIYTWTKQ